LSACESGIATLSTNDEIAGVAHAFLCGGAASVLASLWYVVQGIGVDLTRGFYSNWIDRPGDAEGVCKIEALRRAQCDAMRYPVLFGLWHRTRHPYLWSAFQLIGGWR
jgi:CHAT domain-containing protein